MSFHVRCELDYELQKPTTFLLALKCIETGGQKIVRESFTIDPSLPTEEFTLVGGMNRFSRLRTSAAGVLKIVYEADVTTEPRVVPAASSDPAGLHQLSPEAIPFLFPSRYCQADRFRQQALDMFGHLTTPNELTAGISDWIFDHVSYVGGSSEETSSAVDTLERRQGVCRDFAHLAIAFCRAMNVPARYATFYAHQLEPPDFHACFEVFIDGLWYVFDPTRLVPLNGLVRIATGRDAADTAFCTIFGSPKRSRMLISCDCSDANFEHVTRDTLSGRNEIIALL